AGYLILVLPLSFAFAVRAFCARQRLAAGLFLLTACAMTVALIATLSRAGWAGLAAIAVAFVIIISLRLPPRRWVLGGAGLLFVGCGALLLFSPSDSPGDALRHRVAHLLDTEGRTYIWQTGLAIFQSRPLLGCGPDAFALAFSQHFPPAYWSVEW